MEPMFVNGGGAVVGIAGRRSMGEWLLGTGTSEHGTDDVPPFCLNEGGEECHQ